MQEYVQKSISTTFPRRSCVVSFPEFSHETAPSRLGIGPSFPRATSGTTASAGKLAFIATADGSASRACTTGRKRSINPCSNPAVLLRESRANSPVSEPDAIAATPTNTAAPSPRRIHCSTPNDRFIILNTLFPASSASASEHAAPSANESSNKALRVFAPSIAAPVRINPRIGPAHGVHNNPVETPNKSDRPIPSGASPGLPTKPPSRTRGRER